MAGGVIVQRKAGATIPESYLERVLKQNPKRMGIVEINKQTGMTATKLGAVPDLETFKQALAEKKQEVYMWFSMYPSTFNEADIQPFLLLGTDEDPLLYVMMEGDYVAPTTGSSHLDVWHASEEMIEEIKELYELCGNDLDKLMIALRGKTQFKNFTNKIKTNGSMLFLPSDGDSWVVEKENKFGRKFDDWGWTSNVLGWNPNKVAEDNATERKAPAKSFAEALGTKVPITPQQPGIVGTRTDTAIPAVKEPLKLSDDPEPVLFHFAAVHKKAVANAALKELKKLAIQVSWNKELPPELVMTKDGKPVTDKAQVDWNSLRIVTKEWKDWEKRQIAKADSGNKDFPKAVQAEGGELSLQEKLALRRAAKAEVEKAQADADAYNAELKRKAEAEAAPLPEPSKDLPKVEEPKHETVREFVPHPTPASQEGVEAIIYDIIGDGERKIPAPKAAKEMDKVSFSSRFGLTSCDEVKFEDGDLWRMVKEFPVEAYLLLKEAMSDLEKAAPAATNSRQKVA